MLFDSPSAITQLLRDPGPQQLKADRHRAT